MESRGGEEHRQVRDQSPSRKPAKAKATSVGLLLTDGNVFLACHSTGNRFYDLPKGMQEEGEPAIVTCCRETMEETGLTVDPGPLQDLGVFPYLKAKDLHLFLWLTDRLPPLEAMSCSSMFEHYRSKKQLPEVDGYRYVPFAEAEARLAKSMAPLIRQIGEQLARLSEKSRNQLE